MKYLLSLFLITVVGASAATVTLNGTSYTTSAHPRLLINGPGGSLDLRIKDPDGAGAGVAPKAVGTNPAWVALQAQAATDLVDYGNSARRYYLRTGIATLDLALYWYADNSQTASHDAALYMLNHIEYWLPLICVETQRECINSGNGYGITSYGVAYWISSWMMAYELMRTEMTSPQRTAFAAKMLNDYSAFGGIDGASGTSCTNKAVSGGSGTITNNTWTQAGSTITSLVLASTVATATVSSTAGLVVGDTIALSGSTGLPNTTFPVITIPDSTHFTFGYIYGPSDGSYLNAGTVITLRKPYLTLPSGGFGTTIPLGSWIFDPNNNYNLGNVTTVIDGTHAYLGGDIGITSDSFWYLPADFQTGQCGFLWAIKHDEWTPPVLTNSSGSSLYHNGSGNMDGGSFGADPGHNLIYSALWGVHTVLLALVDDDANFATRSGPELTLAYNFWYANPYNIAEQLWTGFHQSGNAYGYARAMSFMPGTAMVIQNSITSAPNLMNGVWAKNLLALVYANTWPNGQRGFMQWGQDSASGGFSGLLSGNLGGILQLIWWFRAQAEGQYANWWMQNLWSTQQPYNGFGNVPGTNLGFTAANIGTSAGQFFLFSDPATTALNLSGAPTTFLFNQSDTGTMNQRADGMISRTGYASALDTLIQFHAETIPEYDHNVATQAPSNWASYKIFKGFYLLAEDYHPTGDETDYGYSEGGQASNYVEVGGSDSNISIANPIGGGIPRASGTADYAYSMADVTQAYVAGVGLQHGYRHLIDFKKASTQQFVVDYSDFLTSSGQTKKAYYHYPNQATTSLSGSTVTSTSTFPENTQILTRVLAPQAVLLATNTTDGTGSMFRLDVCPSTNGSTCNSANTQSAMLVVHMPVAGAGNSMPVINLIGSIDANFDGVEIKGSSPKAALFAKAGALQTTAAFTGTWTGTAQVAVMGLQAGTYNVVANGVSVGSYAAASTSDMIYFESGPGVITLSQGAPPPPPPPPPITSGVSVRGSRVSNGTIR